MKQIRDYSGVIGELVAGRWHDLRLIQKSLLRRPLEEQAGTSRLPEARRLAYHPLPLRRAS
jgi:hypothetical protein